jgi:anti-anti-sigma factor
LSERIISREVETHEVLGIVLALRDVLARSLLDKYHKDFQRLSQALDAFEPATNRIAAIVAASFVGQRERVIGQQQKAIRELSTPVLQVRERLLILPIIGAIDGARAQQLTEQLLRAVRTNRAKVVVVDITGVPDVDSAVANHLIHAVEASRLMGATVIVSGLSSEIAQTLVTLGIDLSTVKAVVDLQGGIEEAEYLLGHKVVKVGTPTIGGVELHAIASAQSVLSDDDLQRLRDDLSVTVSRHRSKGVIIDVTVMDVLDSFATRTLRAIAHMLRLRGAETVIVGIQPEVAFSMVQLGLSFTGIGTALDLEEGLTYLDRHTRAAHGHDH